MVNNDFTEWKMYAIGGSANPTINSQGNRYIAPPDPNAKEVNLQLNFHQSSCVKSYILVLFCAVFLFR